MIREQGTMDVIPSRSNRRMPKDFDADIDKDRNKTERFPGRLKASFRRIATRYGKTSRNFLAMVKLASVRLSIKSYESLPSLSMISLPTIIVANFGPDLYKFSVQTILTDSKTNI